MSVKVLYDDLRLLPIFGYMDNLGFNKDKLIKFWTDGSNDDFDTMIAMYESKRYNWALFIGHLMI